MGKKDDVKLLRNLLEDGVISQEQFDTQVGKLLEKERVLQERINPTTEPASEAMRTHNRKITMAIVIIGMVALVLLAFAIRTLGTGESKVAAVPQQVSVPTATEAIQSNAKLALEQARVVESILLGCGVDLISITPDERLDNYRQTQSTGYWVQTPDTNEVVLLINVSGEVEMVMCQGRALYQDGVIKNDLYDILFPPDFEFVGKTKKIKDDYSTTIEGKLKNNTGKTASFVSISFGLYDKGGNKVATAIDNISNLNPGGIWKFSALSTYSENCTYKFEEITYYWD